MTKNGNVFKGDNIYIHASSIYIYTGNNNLVRFNGKGDDVDYPRAYSSPLKLGLYQPLIGTLYKGREYKFEIKCESIEDIRIKIGTEIIKMDRNNDVYTKTLIIDSSNTESYLYIAYWRNLTVDYYYDYSLYQYKLIK